jgi:hypothetical protein
VARSIALIAHMLGKAGYEGPYRLNRMSLHQCNVWDQYARGDDLGPTRAMNVIRRASRLQVAAPRWPVQESGQYVLAVRRKTHGCVPMRRLTAISLCGILISTLERGEDGGGFF